MICWRSRIFNILKKNSNPHFCRTIFKFLELLDWLVSRRFPGPHLGLTLWKGSYKTLQKVKKDGGRVMMKVSNKSLLREDRINVLSELCFPKELDEQLPYDWTKWYTGFTASLSNWRNWPDVSLYLTIIWELGWRDEKVGLIKCLLYHVYILINY